MIKFPFARPAAVFAGVLLIAACATSNVVIRSWKDSHYQRKVSKVLVIGLSTNNAIRHSFEDTLADQLRRRGVTATPSSDFIPLNGSLDKDTVRAEVKSAIRGKGYDAVLVTHLVRVDRRTTYVPPTSHLEYSFYRNIITAYSVVYTPGYLVHETVVSLESNLYDTASERLVWSLTSQSFNPADAMDVIKPLSDIIVKNLADHGPI